MATYAACHPTIPVGMVPVDGMRTRDELASPLLTYGLGNRRSMQLSPWVGLLFDRTLPAASPLIA